MGGIPTNLHGEVIDLHRGDANATVPGLVAIGPDLSWNMELMTALDVQNLYA